MTQYEGQLVDQWRTDGPHRKGYRQLAKWFNITMLRREMDQAGLSALGQKAAAKYEHLEDREPSVAEEVASDLVAAGIDTDRLRDDFVSYAVIRSHLKECLCLESTTESDDWEADSIEIAREYATEKLTAATQSLYDKGVLRVGDLSVSVDVQFECESCHTTVPAERAIRRRNICHCQ